MNIPKLELGEAVGASRYEAPTAVVAEGPDQFPDLEAQGGGIEGVQGGVARELMGALNPEALAMMREIQAALGGAVPLFLVGIDKHDKKHNRNRKKNRKPPTLN